MSLPAALAAALDRVRDAVAAVGDQTPPVVLIDGRSGAGKTTLTAALVAQWPLTGPVQQLALDSIYPGWDGLDAGVERALHDVLIPRAQGRTGVWRRYDWVRGVVAEAHEVDPAVALVVEGAGILTPATRALADIAVWLESPEPSRRARALARDGDTYRPHWERWALQEDEHVRRDDPRSLATVVAEIP